ncbi:unnamed protein product [Brugia pahangi]|uniref:ABC transporter permease n=1 Tax=Brugia pahangi TaxID=6280 RepID=A0A0N4TM38_BRUPA|nr:unnamed protein product [Brugia pahangi]
MLVTRKSIGTLPMILSVMGYWYLPIDSNLLQAISYSGHFYIPVFRLSFEQSGISIEKQFDLVGISIEKQFDVVA